ncbi:hypothetical protein ACFL1U_01210 [Patescibacteria group bacterium]
MANLDNIAFSDPNGPPKSSKKSSRTSEKQFNELPWRSFFADPNGCPPGKECKKASSHATKKQADRKPNFPFGY